MRKRIPPSEQIWQGMTTALREGNDRGGHPLDSLVEVGARYALQLAVEQEVSEHLKRRHYERAPEAVGYRNGYEHKGVATEVGRLEVQVPQVRDCEAFHSEVLKRFTQGTPVLKRLVLSMYVRGHSVRDIEACFEEAFEGRVLSKSAVSEVTQTIGEQFAQWKARDLSDLRVAYLFLDGHYLRLRKDTDEKEGILKAKGCFCACRPRGYCEIIQKAVTNRLGRTIHPCKKP